MSFIRKTFTTESSSDDRFVHIGLFWRNPQLIDLQDGSVVDCEHNDVGLHAPARAGFYVITAYMPEHRPDPFRVIAAIEVVAL